VCSRASSEEIALPLCKVVKELKSPIRASMRDAASALLQRDELYDEHGADLNSFTACVKMRNIELDKS
jgi:hypothetical protein